MDDLKGCVDRARRLLGGIDEARAKAAQLGVPAGALEDVGYDAANVAKDSILLTEQIELYRGTGANMERIGALVRELHGLTDGHGRAPEHRGSDSDLLDVEQAEIRRLEGENAALASKLGEVTEALRLATQRHDPPVEKPKQIAPAALGGASPEPTPPKARAVEKEIAIDTWELDGADFKALAKQGYDRERVTGALPAFREANKGKTGKRPRVTLATYLVSILASS